MTGESKRPGATPHPDGSATFRVWAPKLETISLHLLEPTDRLIGLEALGSGWFESDVPEVPVGSRYKYRFPSGDEWPDPASSSQPDGVHGPSEVTAAAFDWSDGGWRGPRMRDLVLYELHVGTFTTLGSFDAIISHLDDLRELGVTAVELMPVSPFPGRRNWGYDGVYPFGVHEAYGGPDGLKRLVDACHAAGLAVVLDVVYNHLGPEGNYLGLYGPFFTDRYRTGWGEAVNVDGPGADGVRGFFIDSARRWVGEFHIDGLRLDAVHAIIDTSADPFLAELTRAVHDEAERHGRRAVVIGESDLNDARLVRSPEIGGLGLDGQWADDFHHALHVALTGESDGYYVDYADASGRSPLDTLATALREPFVYSGQRSAYRERRHGNSARGLPGERFVVASQNHDQVGNRARGERLTCLVPPEALRVAAAVTLFSPYVPLLFMGEEYGEPAPFQYFVSHTDPALVEAVRAGRRNEFASFGWADDVPDPQAESTFRDSTLDLSLRDEEPHRSLLAFYKTALRLRREHPALGIGDPADVDVTVFEPERVLVVRRHSETRQLVVILSFNPAPVEVAVPLPTGRWHGVLNAHATGAAPPEGPFLADGRPLLLRLDPFSVLVLDRS